MRLITIEVTYEGLRVTEGKDNGARREWTATSALDVWLKGAFSKTEYEQACNLAMQVALEMHIPLIAFRRVQKASDKMRRVVDKSQKRMF